ncbi:MAG: PLP-dependent aminotransferase family protein [Deltaproteobacteria bacterium]|nr:PLP-dependent aminotransferase family protein [Deltaproteobacteria bacterium]
MNNQEEVKYERISRELRSSIRTGTYRPGDKLPSLREICRTYGVSLGTAVEAYGRLQDDGLLTPRDRSGFFVSGLTSGNLPPPRQPTNSGGPVPVRIGAMAIRILDSLGQPGMVNLGAGIPSQDFLPSKSLARSISSAARSNPGGLSRYSGVSGEIGLRRQIARVMNAAGVTGAPEEIIITNGCQEALVLALQAVAEPGDTIAVESPTFFGLLQAAEGLGIKVVEMPLEYPRGVTPETVARVIANHPIRACLLTPNFNNPTGVLMPEQDKQLITKILAGAGIPLIEDDIFGFISFSAPRHRAAASYDNTGNTILCSSFSKSISPGLRLGWIQGGRFTEKIKEKKFLANIGTGTLPQIGLASLLARGGVLRGIRRFADRMHGHMLQMRRDIQDLFPPGTRMSEPQGGLYLWVELPGGLDGEALFNRCLEQGISIMPGILFSPSGAYRNHIRLTFSAEPPQVCRAALRKVASLLPDIPRTDG